MVKETNELSMPPGTAKLEDVARLAGVSKSAASKILSCRASGRTSFSTETQKRVREAASKLDYRPSRLAQGLTKSRTGIVGLVSPPIENNFFANVFSAFQARLNVAGCSVILSDTRFDPNVELDSIQELLDWRVDGLVIVSSQGAEDAGPFWDLWERGVPFVLVDRYFTDAPFYSVTTDDYTGAMQATEHLLSMGFRRVAKVGPSLVSAHRLFHNGYVDALRRHGIKPDPSYMVELPITVREELGYAAARQLMDLKTRPDAILCIGDLIAWGAMQYCVEHGVRIPEDIGLVGYGDIYGDAFLHVPLTSVRLPRKEMGDLAAQILIARMEGKSPGHHQQVLSPLGLVIRSSSVPR